MISAGVEDSSGQPGEPLHPARPLGNVLNMISRGLVLDILAGRARLNPHRRSSALAQSLVLLFLHARQDASGVSRVTRQEIADGIQLTRGAVYQAVNALRDVGTLDVEGEVGTLEIRVNLAGNERGPTPP